MMRRTRKQKSSMRTLTPQEEELAHLEVLLCGVLQGDRQEVRPALGQGYGQDGGLSLLGIQSA